MCMWMDTIRTVFKMGGGGKARCSGGYNHAVMDKVDVEDGSTRRDSGIGWHRSSSAEAGDGRVGTESNGWRRGEREGDGGLEAKRVCTYASLLRCIAWA